MAFSLRLRAHRAILTDPRHQEPSLKGLASAKQLVKYSLGCLQLYPASIHDLAASKQAKLAQP